MSEEELTIWKLERGNYVFNHEHMFVEAIPAMARFGIIKINSITYDDNDTVTIQYITVCHNEVGYHSAFGAKVHQCDRPWEYVYNVDCNVFQVLLKIFNDK
ncbi:MAG: hypothetical protein DRI98_14905 [Bacteroidetes bacterium]|nr:MAG: hypothetical protein DRI98_14905 [Bacteroidota bacterium]